MTGFEEGFFTKCAQIGVPLSLARELFKVANQYMGNSPLSAATMQAGGGVGSKPIASPTMPKPMNAGPKPPSPAPTLGGNVGKM